VCTLLCQLRIVVYLRNTTFLYALSIFAETLLVELVDPVSRYFKPSNVQKVGLDLSYSLL
jgi:hypothetical protein